MLVILQCYRGAFLLAIRSHGDGLDFFRMIEEVGVVQAKESTVLHELWASRHWFGRPVPSLAAKTNGSVFPVLSCRFGDGRSAVAPLGVRNFFAENT